MRRVKAGYDVADPAFMKRHWDNSDDVSPDVATNSSVRKTVRQRSRYEIANNSYAKGIVETLVNDVVGTGPRLQLLLPSREVNQLIEAAFQSWQVASRFMEKYQSIRRAVEGDGEGIAIMVTNPMVPNEIKLDLTLVEADQLANPFGVSFNARMVDGILFDAYGNPAAYFIQERIPGDPWSTARSYGSSYKTYPARDVIHRFRQDRPGQHRGVPRLTPALPLFGKLRGYTLSVIDSARSAANFSWVMGTNTPLGQEDTTGNDWEEIELENGMGMVLPGGYSAMQMKAEQPNTTYKDFKAEIINEIARCLNMPFNIAAGNSAGYNYSSGRLDHQTYFKSIRVEQAMDALTILDRVFYAWLREALLLPQFLPMIGAFPVGFPPHQWFFDGTEHVDPMKEAAAQKTRLLSGTTTLAAEYAREGKDYEVELRQRSRELELADELEIKRQVNRQKLLKENNLTEDDMNPVGKENENATQAQLSRVG